MTAAGLIFSNIHDSVIKELTQVRTMASVPFGCRYRLIDFALSNMVNANINTVGIITHNNYQSLFDHVGTGKDWDLARRNGGIKILPPFISSYPGVLPSSQTLYTTRLEALMGVINFIENCQEDTFVLSDCDTICNLDLGKVMKFHEENAADATFVSADLSLSDHPFHADVITLSADENGRLTGLQRIYPEGGTIRVCSNIIVIKRRFLLKKVLEAAAKGQKDFYMDIVAAGIGNDRFFVYHHDKFYAAIGSMEGYFAYSMELIDKSKNAELFGVPGFPIYTKVRNTAPTKYTSGAKVKNSLIADGCIIEGTVENSIIFRGVRVGKGAVVKNSILMQNSYVGQDAMLNCVITDKNVIIGSGRVLSGYQTLPFFISKNSRV